MSDKQLNIDRSVRGNGESTTRPIMLAIAGDSATGKTTISEGLVSALGPSCWP